MLVSTLCGWKKGLAPIGDLGLIKLSGYGMNSAVVIGRQGCAFQLVASMKPKLKSLHYPVIRFLCCVLGLISVQLSGSTRSVCVQELLEINELTPASFFRHFTDFNYKYQSRIQSPEVFLFTRSGDCDDFATLADQLLKEHGYTTKLISVRMPGKNHVVCYVEEEKVYLDFNNRVFLRKLVRCDEGIAKIAKKVARSFGQQWTSATEFRFETGLRKPLKTVFSGKET